MLRRDGSRLPVEIQARSFPYRGQVLRVVAVRDISERKRAERVRESLIRELEAKNAELERFGYAVTHDLKAPLVTIRGFADYLEQDAREGRGDRLAQDAARISEAVARLQRLLDRLFELSRAGRPVGPPRRCPPPSWCRRRCGCSASARRRRAAASRSLPSLPVVFGDRARLVQVFHNLLDNAMKFGGGGRVRVRARAPEDGRVVLVVQDGGIGIEPRHRERVLDIFERLDPRGEGSGVGLAVVKRILESQGGRVWLESEGPGAGTAACVELALEPRPRQAAARGGVEPAGASGSATPSRLAARCSRRPGSRGRCRAWLGARRRRRPAPPSGRRSVRTRSHQAHTIGSVTSAHEAARPGRRRSPRAAAAAAASAGRRRRPAPRLGLDLRRRVAGQQHDAGLRAAGAATTARCRGPRCREMPVRRRSAITTA